MENQFDSLKLGTPAAGTSTPAAAQRNLLKVGMFVVAAALLGILGGVYFLRTDGVAEVISDDTKVPVTVGHAGPVFVGWGKPDLVIVFTSQMHGYLQECGCSAPQLGGMYRRYNFIKSLHDKKWPIVLVDVGEIASDNYGPQTMLKYITAMKALKIMDYAAVGLGRSEFNMPLHSALGNYSLNNPEPTPISSNLAKTDGDGDDYYDLNVRKYKIIDKIAPKVGIVSAVDPKIISQIKDPASKFVPTINVLPHLLKEMRLKGTQINVLLYQGHDKQKELGECLTDMAIAAKNDKGVPPIQIALCLSDDSEPPGRLKAIGSTQVATAGHKGRYVGVLGLFKKGIAYELKYELVAMGEQYKSPKGQEAENPIIKLMEEYTQIVKRDNYLSKFPRSFHSTQLELKKNFKVNAYYVGSDRCGDCHDDAYKVWKNSKHSHAFDSLVSKAKFPSLRQHDGECVVCHTVGFQHNTGYYDSANNEKQNKKLLNVGCESCHGPGSAHAANPDNKALYPYINPYSANAVAAGKPAVAAAMKKVLENKLDGFCQKCHDIDNDVHWTNMPFAQKWAQIAHPTPPKPKAGN